jgi:transglutaminase-like putative cysteine protease
MTYRIVHKTIYKYKHAVSVGNHMGCLTPRSLPHHRCIGHELRVHPPAKLTRRTDYFGNQLSFFTIQQPHRRLIVEARSEVVIEERTKPLANHAVPWEGAVKVFSRDYSAESLEAYQFVFESPRIRPNAQFAAYALKSFTPGRPLIEALLDLTSRIHADFRFEAGATNVRTPPEEVFRKRCGVCQDFAHLEIACLRSLNLAARYVSGYLRTYPPPGVPRLVGADVSHAWVSVYCPGIGWFDVDPTNNVVPSCNHVTVGWGRDYGDVSPLRGLILGGRDHTLKVSVDVEEIQPSSPTEI